MPPRFPYEAVQLDRLKQMPPLMSPPEAVRLGSTEGDAAADVAADGTVSRSITAAFFLASGRGPVSAGWVDS